MAHADDPLFVRVTAIVCWPVPPLLVPRATLRLAGWQVLALPAACACDDELGVDAASPVRAVEAALADAVVEEPAEELLELEGEQPATVSPAAKTQIVTAVDVRNRMESSVVLGHEWYGFNAL